MESDITPRYLHEEASPDFTVWTIISFDWQTTIFADIARSMAESLRALGFKVSEFVGFPASPPKGRIVAFGNVTLSGTGSLPSDAIIMQLEHVTYSFAFTPEYLQYLQRYTVFDFSEYNVRRLRERGVSAHLCRIGSTVNPIEVETRSKDIDVLFYGYMTERRAHIVEKLRAVGLRVHTDNAKEKELATLIARSKVLLNMHLLPNGVLEMVRLSHAIEHRACVVSETGEDPGLERILNGGIVLVPYEKLVEAAIQTVNKTQSERDMIAQKGYELFRAFPYKYEIARCLTEIGVKMDRVQTVLGFVEMRGYRRYLEIGCEGNHTFAQVPIAKIGVDPVSGGTHRMTSDEFFRHHGDESTFDIVFIDGDHHHDQVYRDVQNSLRCLRSGGVIVMHDCLPPDAQHESLGLCGTAWRAFAKLREDPNLECVVGDYDYGVGIVRVATNTAPVKVPAMSEMTYAQFVQNRATWMRPVGWDVVQQLMKARP